MSYGEPLEQPKEPYELVEVELFDDSEPDGMFVVRSTADVVRMYRMMRELELPAGMIPYKRLGYRGNQEV
jgi:hypothetical protein